MAKGKSGFSLRTKDAVDGGGTEGALATITEIGFVEGFNYGGRVKGKEQVALHVVYEIEGFDKPWDQNYTVGPQERYELVDDGDGVRSATGGGGLNKRSSAYAFFGALEEAAEASDVDLDEILPEIDGEGAMSVRPLEGRQVRLKNIKFETVGGDTKDLVVIGALVDEDEAPAKSKNGKSSKGSKGFDVEEYTESAITELIEEHTSVKVGDLAQMIYAADKKNPNIKAAMQLALKKTWLSDEDRPWSFDAKKGVLREVD